MARNVPWTAQENELLMWNAPNMTVNQLTEMLVPVSPKYRSAENVRVHCRQLVVHPIAAGKHDWTDAEEEYLQQNYGNISVSEIARELGVSRSSVTSKVNKMRKASAIEPVNQTKTARMRRITPWMPNMLKLIGDTRKNVYDIACDLWEYGREVSVEEEDGMLAVFCRLKGPLDGICE